MDTVHKPSQERGQMPKLTIFRLLFVGLKTHFDLDRRDRRNLNSCVSGPTTPIKETIGMNYSPSVLDAPSPRPLPTDRYSRTFPP